MGAPSASVAVDGISPPSGPPQHMGRHQEPAKRIDRGHVDGIQAMLLAKIGRIRHGKRYRSYSELISVGDLGGCHRTTWGYACLTAKPAIRRMPPWSAPEREPDRGRLSSGPSPARPGARESPGAGAKPKPSTPGRRRRAPEARSSYREVFAIGEFRALWSAQVPSFAGDQFAQVAIAILVYGRTRSPFLTARPTRSPTCRRSRVARCCPVWRTFPGAAG